MKSLQEKFLLQSVKEELSPELEIPAVLQSSQTRPLLFEKVSGVSMKLAGNLYGKREYLALGLGVDPPKLADSLRNAVASPSSSGGKVRGFRASDWDYNGDCDLGQLPILKHFERDAGSYLTAGIVVARFPGSKLENLSFHRMLVLGKNKVAARIVPRHLQQILKETPDQRVRVSVVIGPPPSVFVSASIQTSFGLSEYSVANKLSNEKLELVTSEMSELALPVDSEIVLEGWLEGKELIQEGPFVDLTGTYDEVRQQPVIKFDRMHWRKDAVYQAVVASSTEHALFMGLPQELRIVDALTKVVPGVRGVNLTAGSLGYFHCIVSLQKGNDGDGKTAILNCFAASHPLKLVIAVDSDIDPFDMKEVEWALATRLQASKGMVLVDGAKGSSLDPSSGKLAVTAKLGLDCTLPVAGDKSKFQKAKSTVSPAVQRAVQKLASAAPSPPGMC